MRFSFQSDSVKYKLLAAMGGQEGRAATLINTHLANIYKRYDVWRRGRAETNPGSDLKEGQAPSLAADSQENIIEGNFSSSATLVLCVNKLPIDSQHKVEVGEITTRSN